MVDEHRERNEIAGSVFGIRVAAGAGIGALEKPDLFASV